MEKLITNSDLETAALVPHEATQLAAVPEARLAAPFLGLDKNLTVSWITKEASTINLVVADILCLRALHSRQFFLNPYLFYHPGIENCMADDDSLLFGVFEISLLAHMSAAYPQSQSLWQLSLLPPDLISCVISTLRRKPHERELHKILASRGSTSRGATSAPPSSSILLSKIRPK